MSSFPDFANHGYQVIRELGRNYEGGRITYLCNAAAQDKQVVIKQFCSTYEAMRVPEVWVYRNQVLKIYVLENGSYCEVSLSPTLPDLSLIELIPQLVQQAIDHGTSHMLRELRTQLNLS